MASSFVRVRSSRHASLVAAFGIVGAVVLGACSSSEDGSFSQRPGTGVGEDGGPGKDGAPGEEQPIPATPEADCPAPFDSPGKGPAEGENKGFPVAGQDRTFTLLLPPASFTGPRPILFAFHGTTENATKFIARAKLTDFVDRGFIVVAPNAVGNGTFWPVWDGMRAPGTETQPNKDVEMFDRLLKCTAAHHPVDKTRVFATGHSAGGIFTNRLLRTRSDVLAGGIPASGVFDLTSGGTKAALSPMTVIVTWGGDNDTYRGTTPNGVTVPAFSFVEQASLASMHYDAENSVAQAYCRGANLGHAWLPINAWFAEVLLSRPKGSPKALTLPDVPGSTTCSLGAYELPPVANVTCGSTARAGCQQACQLFADCAVENRTVGVALSSTLQGMGFTTTSCGGCVSQCQAGATSAADAAVLSCFQQQQATAQCGAGIEGAIPLYSAVNTCCKNRSDSGLCVQLCTGLVANEAAAPFFSGCNTVVN